MPPGDRRAYLGDEEEGPQRVCVRYSWCIGHSLVPPISQELLIRSGLMRLPSARLSFRSIKARVHDISAGRGGS